MRLEGGEEPGRGTANRAFLAPTGRPRPAWSAYAWSAAAIILLTVVAKAVEPWIGYPSIDLFYLLPVILAATFFGLRPGVAAAIASGVFYNFFFIPPQHTLHIHDPQDIATLVVLVVVAIVISQLAGRVRAQAEVGERRAKDNAAIAAFTGTLAGLSNEKDTAEAICSEIARLFQSATVLLAPGENDLDLVATAPGPIALDPEELSAASAAYRGNGSAAVAAGNATAWRFWRLEGSLGTMAMVGVRGAGFRDKLDTPDSDLFGAVVERAARAYERLRVEQEVRSVEALRERERLRSTLLSSIGHDLRTPLTALTAAAEALAAREEHSELVATIRGEARRLRRFFDDLVDMTRIESGSLAPHAEPVDLTDAASAAVDDLKLALQAHKVSMHVPPSLPLVRTDATLLHHILINLLDNAAKFSPAGSEVRLRAEEVGGGVELSVTDEGPGLPAGREARVFDTFARLEGSDRTGGSGLGLAIVKGFAEAMELRASAANRRDSRGARMSIFFPPALMVAPGRLSE